MLVAVGVLVALFFLVGISISRFETRFAAHFLAVPLVGWLWRILFLPRTYYRLDTEAMYRAAVHGAVMEVVDAMTEAKGLRKLSEDERKPVLQDFMRR